MRLLTEQEVAKELRISVQSLRNNRCQGVGLPYVKIGRLVRYVEDDVIADIQRRRIDPEARR